MALKDAPRCEAKSKSTGERCKNPAVKGKAVCRLHGAHGGRPLIHGMYRGVVSEKVRQKLEAIDNYNPTGLLDELSLQRAVFSSYLEETLHEHVKLDAQQVDYIMRFSESIGKTVDRIVKQQNETALTAAEIQFLKVRIVDLLARYIDDPSKQDTFIAELFGVGRSRARHPQSIEGET